MAIEHSASNPTGGVELCSNGIIQSDHSSNKEKEEEGLNFKSEAKNPDGVEDPGNTHNQTLNDAAANENIDASSEASSDIVHEQRRAMDRLVAAIKKSTAFLPAETDASSKTVSKSDDRRSINVSFNGSQNYIIPWMACCTWQRMEIILNEWFHGDEKALSDISIGAYALKSPERGLFHPQVWEHVLENNSDVEFWHQSALQPPGPPTGPKNFTETDYENRVQYTVRYYQDNQAGDNALLVDQNIYEEPVEFEVANENEKLPVLEERKDVLSPFQQTPQIRKENGHGKKARLGPLDRVIATSLRIHSPYLLNILKSVIEYSSEQPGGDIEGLNGGNFTYPYRDLYHHMDDLHSYKTDATGLRARHSSKFNQKCDEHIDLLVEYLHSRPGIPINDFKAQWERKTPVTTFAAVWLLLKPGTDVYVRETDGTLNTYVVDVVSDSVIGEDGRPSSDKYSVLVWNLVCGGRMIYRRTRSITVNVFDNEREITALPLFPVSFIDKNDGGALKQKLIDRGQQYFKCSKGPCFLQYTGFGLNDGRKSYKRTRVVVEHESMPWFSADIGIENTIPPPPPPTEVSIRVPRCECKDCKLASISQEIYTQVKFSDYTYINPKEKAALSWHQYLLMPSHMFAFVLKDRTYDFIDVEGLSEPSMAEFAIDRLVMESSSKDIIKAIAKTYTDSEQSGRFSADFIHGKGEGQIILLHGPPGTGKTLTAESVAEYTRRPLLSITAADLGHEPDALEKNLLRYFRRASDWDAIVLLDEADVYLEQRSTNDLKRNGIVSVFLRALDYFQGILFLTTNRVGQFDEAFMSRIHLSIGYKKLDSDARGQIWDNLFRKLREDHEHGGPAIDYEYDSKQYVKTSEVMALEWNGREIRNAFQTAVALAVFDSKQKKGTSVPKVTENHLRQVVSMSLAFRKYIKAAHAGMDDSDLAFKRGNREDRFPSTPGK
ncbi:hypothetical protein BKA66DRAFT_566658 [Pyrenochaeta sp. MPI-SDFR-AT-0127]|nr:hypothetical protein BKA66DRAFT_566658 [Pyrenochaeta sp. MPI-SDFR-AT-0127]